MTAASCHDTPRGISSPRPNRAHAISRACAAAVSTNLSRHDNDVRPTPVKFRRHIFGAAALKVMHRIRTLSGFLALTARTAVEPALSSQSQELASVMGGVEIEGTRNGPPALTLLRGIGSQAARIARCSRVLARVLRRSFLAARSIITVRANRPRPRSHGLLKRTASAPCAVSRRSARAYLRRQMRARPSPLPYRLGPWASPCRACRPRCGGSRSRAGCRREGRVRAHRPLASG